MNLREIDYSKGGRMTTRRTVVLTAALLVCAVMFLAGCCNVGVYTVKKYDKPEEYAKAFPKDAGNVAAKKIQVMNFEYDELRIHAWAFWNLGYWIFYYLPPGNRASWEIEMLVTPEYFHEQFYMEGYHPVKMDEKHCEWVKEGMPDWFALDAEHYTAYAWNFAEIEWPRLFIDKRTRDDKLIHIFVTH